MSKRKDTSSWTPEQDSNSNWGSMSGQSSTQAMQGQNNNGGNFWGNLWSTLLNAADYGGPESALSAKTGQPEKNFTTPPPSAAPQYNGNTGEHDGSSRQQGQFYDDKDRGAGAGWTNIQTPAQPVVGTDLLGGLGDFLGGLGQMTQGMSDKALFNQVPQAPTFTPQTYEYQPVDLPTAKEFEFKQKDFTDQANAAAAKAYSPQFASVDAARTEAKNRNAQQDELVQGIGSQLLEGLAKAQSTRQEGLSDAAKAATQAGDTQANAGAASYAGAEKQAAALLAKYGVADDMGRQLAATSKDSLERQDAARTAAASTAKGYNQEKSDTAKQSGEINRATALQTASDRQDLISQLNQALYGYDQDELGIESEQNLNAQQMANTLSDRDFQYQQAAYGQYNNDIDRATQVALANASAAQQAGLANVNAANQAGQANAEAAYNQQAQTIQAQQQQRQAEIAAQADAAKAAQDQANKDRDYGLDAAELQLKYDPNEAAADINLKNAQAGAANRSGLPTDNGIPLTQQDPLTQVRALVTEQTGSSVQADDTVQFLNQMSSDPATQNMSKWQFVNKASEEAGRNPGLNPSVAANAAAQWWDAFFSKGTGQG